MLAQVFGRSPDSYTYDDVNKQALIDAVNRNQAVTTGTFKNIPSGTGLIGYHAYAVIGYDAATDTFRLANPHGTRHPGPLSWTQLKQNCGYFGVANTAAVQPFGSVSEQASLAEAPVDALLTALGETTGRMELSCASPRGAWAGVS